MSLFDTRTPAHSELVAEAGSLVVVGIVLLAISLPLFVTTTHKSAQVTPSAEAGRFERTLGRAISRVEAATGIDLDGDGQIADGAAADIPAPDVEQRSAS